MMDEFVALYIGLQGNKNLEQKFRESLGVSPQSSYFVFRPHKLRALTVLLNQVSLVNTRSATCRHSSRTTRLCWVRVKTPSRPLSTANSMLALAHRTTMRVFQNFRTLSTWVLTRLRPSLAKYFSRFLFACFWIWSLKVSRMKRVSFSINTRGSFCPHIKQTSQSWRQFTTCKGLRIQRWLSSSKTSFSLRFLDTATRCSNTKWISTSWILSCI